MWRWFIGVLLLASIPAFAQSDEARARELFENGSLLYDEGSYEEAVTAFQAAYDISQKPLLLYNMASALERLARWEEALAALNSYRAFARADERETLESRIRKLRERLDERDAVEEPIPAPEPIAPAPEPIAPAPPALPAPVPERGNALGIALIATGSPSATSVFLNAMDGAISTDADPGLFWRTVPPDDIAFDEDPGVAVFASFSYDAAMLALYGAAWAHHNESGLSGVNIARGLRQVSDTSLEAFPIRGTRYAEGVEAMTDGQAINLTVASGELDFDDVTGETSNPIEVWVINDTQTDFDPVRVCEPDYRCNDL